MRAPLPLTLAFLLSAGCMSSAASAPELETRVQKLEREVAFLNAARSNPAAKAIEFPVLPVPGAGPHVLPVRDSKGCVLTDYPASTTFRYDVPFDIGEQTLPTGDTIVITEVRGTHPDFRVGGVYLVRGQFKLVSAAEASLSFTVTGHRTGDGCTHGNANRRTKIVNGSGTFELASIMPYQGWPHISLYPSSGGQPSARVYFGKDEYLHILARP